MFNIAHFQQSIKDNWSPSYKIYYELYEQNLIESPIIYADSYLFRPTNIPIFNTWYIRESFRQKYILLDYADYPYIPPYLKNKCITIYNNLFHDKNKINESFLNIEIDSNAVQIIKDNCDETI